MGCLDKNCQHADFNLIKQYCQHQSIKLTALREQVLRIISQADKPLTAYAILDLLRESKPNAQVMTVYRIITFLLENGLIHRLESLNAVILCHHLSDKVHFCQWLICRECGGATECDLPIFQQGLADLSEVTGFQVGTPVIELSGLCVDCQTIAP